MLFPSGWSEARRPRAWGPVRAVAVAERTRVASRWRHLKCGPSTSRVSVTRWLVRDAESKLLSEKLLLLSLQVDCMHSSRSLESNRQRNHLPLKLADTRSQSWREGRAIPGTGGGVPPVQSQLTWPFRLPFSHISSDSFLCDCQLKWLPPWLLGRALQGFVAATCAHPEALKGQSIFAVPPESFVCGKTVFVICFPFLPRARRTRETSLQEGLL